MTIEQSLRITIGIDWTVLRRCAIFVIPPYGDQPGEIAGIINRNNANRVSGEYLSLCNFVHEVVRTFKNIQNLYMMRNLPLHPSPSIRCSRSDPGYRELLGSIFLDSCFEDLPPLKPRSAVATVIDGLNQKTVVYAKDFNEAAAQEIQTLVHQVLSDSEEDNDPLLNSIVYALLEICNNHNRTILNEIRTDTIPFDALQPKVLPIRVYGV